MKSAVILVVLATLSLAGCSDNLEPGLAYTTCIRGQMFAVLAGYKSESIVQIWENGPDGPRPMECKEVGR